MLPCTKPLPLIVALCFRDKFPFPPPTTTVADESACSVVVEAKPHGFILNAVPKAASIRTIAVSDLLLFSWT